MCELKQNNVWSMLIRGENSNLSTPHFMLIVCQINDSSNPIACFIGNEKFDPEGSVLMGRFIEGIFISA